MPRLVTIVAGAYNVELPNGISYNATHAATTNGPQVILTDEEFAKTVVDGVTIEDLGNVGTSVVTVQAAKTADPAAATAVAVTTTASTSTTPYGYSTSAQADALVTNVNALVVDVASVRTALDNLLAALQVAGGPQASV